MGLLYEGFAVRAGGLVYTEFTAVLPYEGFVFVSIVLDWLLGATSSVVLAFSLHLPPACLL